MEAGYVLGIYLRSARCTPKEILYFGDNTMRPSNASGYLSELDLRILQDAVAVLSKETDNSTRLGGVLAISCIDEQRPIMNSIAAISIGSPGEKITSFAFNASEKIRRLKAKRVKNLSLPAGRLDIAASQSADNKTTWGGCVVFGLEGDSAEIYISFSGAPAEVDEAIVYVLGEKLRLTPPPGYENPLILRARELIILMSK